MKVLAIDTSSRCGAVGISIDGHGIAEAAVWSKENHSARLLPTIDWLLRTSGIAFEEIDAFGIVLGPGSFTGLRVGLATVKGLAWDGKKPVTSLNSLDVLARPFCYTQSLISPMLYSGKGKVYGAIYEWKNGAMIAIQETADAEASEIIRSIDRETIFLGDGARKFEGEITSALQEKARFAPLSYDVPRGLLLAELAYERIQKGITVNLKTVEPVYLRLTEAELKARPDV